MCFKKVKVQMHKTFYFFGKLLGVVVCGVCGV